MAAIRNLIRSQREAPTMTTDPNQTLFRIRAFLDRLNQAHDVDSPLRTFLDLIADLDDHLSAGGTPPEAWREGPDAPTDDTLPPEAQAVADHVTRELWTAVDNGDCEGEADYAADVAERLSFVYGVVGHRADEYEDAR